MSSSSSSTISNSNIRRRIVKFNPKATMRLTTHINNYTPDEKSSTFFNDQDYRMFKEDIKDTYLLIHDGLLDEDQESEQFCTLGVKGNLLLGGGSSSSSLAKKSRFAVFMEQTRQRHLHFVEPQKTSQEDSQNKIALAYIKAIQQNAVASEADNSTTSTASTSSTASTNSTSRSPSSPRSIMDMFSSPTSSSNNKQIKQVDIGDDDWQLYVRSPTTTSSNNNKNKSKTSSSSSSSSTCTRNSTTRFQMLMRPRNMNKGITI